MRSAESKKGGADQFIYLEGSPTGTSLSATTACGMPPMSITYGYEATATSFTIHDNVSETAKYYKVHVYTKM